MKNTMAHISQLNSELEVLRTRLRELEGTGESPGAPPGGPAPERGHTPPGGFEVTPEEFRALAESVPGVVYRCRLDPGRTVLYVNRAVESLTGFPEADFLEGRLSFADLAHPQERARIAAHVEMALSSGKDFRLSYRIRRSDGEWRRVEEHGRGIHGPDGELLYLQGFLLDVTERVQAEREREEFLEQAEQSQRLESLGILAGGIAHDFNNLLTGVLGGARLALHDLAPGHPARRPIQDAVQAAEQATDLTRQMLAYSGGRPGDVVSLDLSENTREIAGLLRSSIPRRVHLWMDLADDLPPVEADPGQMQQLVMNLATNAAEALEGSTGTVSIATGVEHLDELTAHSLLPHRPLEAGLYVYVEVRDDGCGMDRRTCVRIFEPFFSTKFTGRGLGLSVVLGTVRSHRGGILVESEPGRGTVFKAFLPACQKPLLPEPGDATAAPEGRELVLVVDDEEVVRSTARESLLRYGFQVLTAEDGSRAVELFREHADEIALVILDMTMPQMNGEETFQALQAIRSDVLVLLSSGYSSMDGVSAGFTSALAGFIQKPYRPRELASKAREALNSRSGTG